MRQKAFGAKEIDDQPEPRDRRLQWINTSPGRPGFNDMKDKDYSLLRPFDEEAAKRGDEFWAPVIGEYLVSNLGRVKGPKGIMRPSETHKGYLRVCLSIDGKQVEAKVHRLVASAFIPNNDNRPQVNHIDGDKQNNNALNLEWCDNKHNQLHYRRVLKGGIVPLVASNDNETILFESGVAAQEAGHNRGEISKIINNPSRKHHGFNWYSKDVFEQKTGVLCWVEGRPVYKGDVLWHKHRQDRVIAEFVNNNGFLCEPGSSGIGDFIENLTWTPLDTSALDRIEAGYQARIKELLTYLEDEGLIYYRDSSGSRTRDGLDFCESCGIERGKPHGSDCILSTPADTSALDRMIADHMGKFVAGIQSIGRNLPSEDDLIAQGIRFADYERGVNDTLNAIRARGAK